MPDDSSRYAAPVVVRSQGQLGRDLHSGSDGSRTAFAWSETQRMNTEEEREDKLQSLIVIELIGPPRSSDTLCFLFLLLLLCSPPVLSCHSLICFVTIPLLPCRAVPCHLTILTHPYYPCPFEVTHCRLVLLCYSLTYSVTWGRDYPVYLSGSFSSCYAPTLSYYPQLMACYRFSSSSSSAL